MKFNLKSHSFEHDEEIPIQFTGEGKDESPALEWKNVPDDTQEFALICDDPDAPQETPFVHWLLYKIPGDLRKLSSSIPPKERLDVPPGALQGKNSFGNIGYGGPLPPPGHGWHHYFFRLHALDTELDITPGKTKVELLLAIEGHVLGTAELMGRYKREKETMKMAG